jgi:hypothetical protein
MSRQLPYLAMDGVLCDRPQEGCFIGGKRNYARDNISNTTKEKKAQMAHIMTSQEVESHTKKLVARLMGQDSAMDDEAVEKLKGFLKSRLSAEDHEQVCNMLAGEGEAQDTEPPPLPGTPRPLGGMDGLSARQRMQAADNAIAKRAQARDSLFAMFPDAAKINIDSSGIQPRGRAASYSAADAASFAAMFPSSMNIKLL